MLKFFFLAVFSLFIFTVSAQEPIPAGQQGFTFGMANGRAWMAMQSRQNKVYYLTGIKDALIVLDPPGAKDYQAAQYSAGEVAASIDQFYAVPENIRSPIVHAVRVAIRNSGDTLQRNWNQ